MTGTPGTVLLLTGPAGSGKTTLARRLADRLGRRMISEDDHWVRAGWSGRRTPEQERAVRDEVTRAVLSSLDGGVGVVLEFIVYQEPPSSLTVYREALEEHGVALDVVVLTPALETVLARIEARGRPSDLEDLEGRRLDAEHQLATLHVGHVGPALVIGADDLPPDRLCEVVAAHLRDGSRSA